MRKDSIFVFDKERFVFPKSGGVIVKILFEAFSVKKLCSRRKSITNIYESSGFVKFLVSRGYHFFVQKIWSHNTGKTCRGYLLVFHKIFSALGKRFTKKKENLLWKLGTFCGRTNYRRIKLNSMKKSVARTWRINRNWFRNCGL